jgi:hypothetical protein
LSNEIATGTKSILSRLSVRTRIVAGIAVIAILIGVIVTGNLANASRQQQFTEYLTQLDYQIAVGDLAGAQKYLDEARLVSPDDEKTLSEYIRKIKSVLDSSNALSAAEDHIAERHYLLAVNALNQVSDVSETLFAKRLSLIEDVSEKAVKAELAQAKSFADQGKFVEASNVLTDAKRILGNLDVLSELQSQYDAKIAQQKKALRASSLAKMYKKFDEFNSTTWYQDSSSPRYTNRNAFYLYFGSSGSGSNPLRLRVQYYDDDWLFIDSAQIAVDGKIYDLNFTEWKRDNDSMIWEWADEVLSDREMIEAIVKSKRAVIRFDGDQYYDTRTISPTEKRALRNVLDAHDSI